MRSIIFKIRFLNNNNKLSIYFKSFIFYPKILIVSIVTMVEYGRKTNKAHLVTQYNENDSE